MTPLEAKKLQLAKLRLEDQAKLRFAFDGNNPESRPTEAQQLVLQDTTTLVHWIICGNRCLVEGTLVATPAGPRPIESLGAGDQVFAPDGSVTKVVQRFDQGEQEVADLVSRGHVVWASSTANHIWQTREVYNKIIRPYREERRADTLQATPVVRTKIHAQLGTVHEPAAYALGALLGDGCCRQKGPAIWISSATSAVPDKVAAQLGTSAERSHPSNYSWRMRNARLPAAYVAWCAGRYAHEKIADLETIKTWDRSSLIAFLAGLVDTDGSVTVGPDTLTLRITMQAKEVLQVAEYALLALWNVQPVWKTDRRSKYKNGPCYNLVVRNPHDSRLVIKELTPHLVTPHKRWQDSFADIGGKRSSATHVTLTWGANKRRVKTYDIEVEHPSHLYVLANGLVTHNSGKSTAGSRMVAWWFMENHPYMERPETWQGPLQILVVGRLGEQMDSELWAQKIKPLLPGGSYKETRIGGMLQRVTNTRNGNRIIFLSHHDAMNAREKVQAFTAHVVWLDEMPDHAGLVTELLMRTLTTGGRLYATFTPLLRNQEIFRLVTQPHPSAKYHKFLMLDNPIFKGKEAEVQAQVRAMCTSEAEYRARLYGEWWEGDARVTRYLPDLHRTELPGDYHAGSWRHLAVLDPAASGLAGLTVWGESPSTGVWYAVRAKYFRGTAAYDLLDSVEAELQGLGHLTRWCDCNPAGFYKEAARRGIPWKAYTEKNDRKHLTLDAFNARLLEGKLKLTPGADALGEELLKAEWAPGGERILNASSYHLLDTARYAADVLPPFAPNRFIVRTQDQEIRAQWKAKKEREQAKAATRARILERRPKWLRRPLSSLRLT